MCNGNSKLKTEDIGNVTLCRVKNIKLKEDAPPLRWKNWDGKKVYTTCAHYVEYVEFERFPDNEAMISLKKDIDALEVEIADEVMTLMKNDSANDRQ